MSIVTVMNLRDASMQEYFCTPEEAVIAAHAQSHMDWNTWQYKDRYGHLVEHGKHTVLCGDFSAFNCTCHPHNFEDWKRKGDENVNQNTEI